jgi:hypothetical protein
LGSKNAEIGKNSRGFVRKAHKKAAALQRFIALEVQRYNWQAGM